MHIGKRIKQVMKQQGRGVTWLAEQLHCDRTNSYCIYKREAVDTILLQKISMILEYDFFTDLSEDTFADKRN